MPIPPARDRRREFYLHRVYPLYPSRQTVLTRSYPRNLPSSSPSPAARPRGDAFRPDRTAHYCAAITDQSLRFLAKPLPFSLSSQSKKNKEPLCTESYKIRSHWPPPCASAWVGETRQCPAMHREWINCNRRQHVGQRIYLPEESAPVDIHRFFLLRKHDDYSEAQPRASGRRWSRHQRFIGSCEGRRART